ncbi:pseudo-response regulator 5 [Striga hermonthica]|uniref:Pseudo-response regulator 5 n=1 Tax=Striga hermonthica TaxID=68872 RepID=A0A9N7R392_STRHE|nr:pseudo-response regulator 5 [Striga hermonthica]
MVVRVLLVEADDSTRQIIAALLRKCSYRAVAAVPDGLKAWEVLKGSPCNIDLILTEVELPSISGYALLTLIMEHEACKNIPVIMMSSQDSVSTVYKCMLKGAADFLVKPIRKNELRNLWQHVWRKQASSTGAGLGPPDESVQQKDETTDENNAISNHSSGHVSCIQRNKQCTLKGSDDQSSCTKPELETEGEEIENGYCTSQQQKAMEECHQESMEKRAYDNEIKGIHIYIYVPNGFLLGGINAENTRALENPCREAIDLIGAFDNHSKGNFTSSPPNASANKFDIFPLLDLSLRRPHNSDPLNPPNDEQPRLNLNHSDASAFSRYINKPSKDQENAPEKNHVFMPSIQLGPQQITFSYSHSQNKEISLPIPVKGIRFENANSAYNNSIIPSLYRAQSGSSSLSSPSTPHHTESFPQSSLFYHLSENQPASSHQQVIIDQKNIGNSVVEPENKPENVEGQQGLVSSGNDESGNSNLCNGNTIHVIKGPSEYAGHEESSHVLDEASKRSMQREAALNKFRLKRKDRCFEKKVRYESRKKLAEQRPRVKGQFVRQVSNDPSSGNTSAASLILRPSSTPPPPSAFDNRDRPSPSSSAPDFCLRESIPTSASENRAKLSPLPPVSTFEN